MDDAATAPPMTASSKQMAEMLAISEVHLGRLSKDGTLPPPLSRSTWDLVATTRAYVQWLQAKGVKAEAERAEEFALTVARRQHTQHRTHLAEIELAEKRGDVVSVTSVGSEVGHMLSGLRGRLVSIPAIVAPMLGLATTAIERQQIVEDAINEALDDLSGTPFSFLGPRARSGGAGKQSG